MEDAGLNTTKPDFKDATRTKRMPACSRNRTCLRMPALINIGNNTLDFKVRVVFRRTENNKLRSRVDFRRVKKEDQDS
ncbi:unnamed protein product [Rhizophagus irregularis]|nr:unnamed protein product [Rhizophagus irregularis]